MNSPRPGPGLWGVAVWAALAIALAASARAQQSDAGWRDVTLAEYRQHLLDLDALVAACQKQFDAQKAAASGTKNSSPAPGNPGANPGACDPKSVGPDDRVARPTGAGSQPREVRYDWLRNVLSLAGGHAPASQPTVLGAIPRTKSQPEDVDALLAQAHERLQDDVKQAAAPMAANEDYAAERKTLTAILAQRAYQHATEISTRERLLEWLGDLLDKLFAGLRRLGSHIPWIVFVLRILLFGGICTALIWFLLRIEWRSRVQLVLDDAPAPGAPSARDWQLWLKDARAKADNAEWREAIHLLYWASIARLESMRLWPADRARTPREYLGLLAGADPRKPTLTAMTRSFERTWYGGRAAAAEDFDAALKQAADLGVSKE
jgi:Domain of unknown function (DUF4129)